MSTDDWARISPTPWDAGDKHAFLYDAEGTTIAEFNTDQCSKSLVDLNNRNRAATCVNALDGIKDPAGFVHIARWVAEGYLNPNVLLDVLSEAPVFMVTGTGPEGDTRQWGPESYHEARETLNTIFAANGGTISMQITHSSVRVFSKEALKDE